MSTRPELFYAKKLENNVNFIFIFTFFVSLFLKSFFFFFFFFLKIIDVSYLRIPLDYSSEFSLPLVHSLIVKNISVSSYSV